MWQRTVVRKRSARSKWRASSLVSTPLADQLAGLVDAIEILGDPEQRVQVAQPALALLDVGLDDVARIAHALMALVALGELGLDEVAAVAGQEFLARSP